MFSIMNIILYIMIFISGTVFGSFFSLAVYRLPRKENITYVRSHCTSCNHRLNSLDLIPILSYIFLGGKCRYCKEKIRSRYILLEIFSGFVFVLVAASLNINAYSSMTDFIKLFFMYLSVCAFFIIGGIDKENYIIHTGTLIFGLIVAILYNIFKINIGMNIYSNIIGALAIPIIALILNILIGIIKKDFNKVPIGFGDIEYISLIGLFFGFGTQVLILILASFITVISVLIKRKKDEIPYGYYFSIASVSMLIFNPLFKNIIELIDTII